jgi:hypothetical protein
MLTGDLVAALADAEQACELNASWNRGWARKGAALFALKRYKDAADAYHEAGMKSEESSQDPGKYFFEKQRCLSELEPKPAAAGERARRPPRAQQPQAGPYAQVPLPNPSGPPQPWDTARDALPLALRVLSLACALAYALGFDDGMFVPSLLIQGLAMGLSVLRTAGMPRMDPQWVETALGHPDAIPSLLCVTYATFPPSIIALLVVHALGLSPMLKQARSLMERLAMTQLAQRMDAALASRYPGSNSLAAQWVSFEDAMQLHAAKFELSLGIALLLQLLSSNRNIVAPLVFSQTIKLRYMSSAATREACRLLDASLAPMAQRFGFERGYARAQRVAAKFVAPPQAPGAPAAAGMGGGGLRGMFAGAADRMRNPGNCAVM